MARLVPRVYAHLEIAWSINALAEAADVPHPSWPGSSGPSVTAQVAAILGTNRASRCLEPVRCNFDTRCAYALGLVRAINSSTCAATGGPDKPGHDDEATTSPIFRYRGAGAPAGQLRDETTVPPPPQQEGLSQPGCILLFGPDFRAANSDTACCHCGLEPSYNVPRPSSRHGSGRCNTARQPGAAARKPTTIPRTPRQDGYITPRRLRCAWAWERARSAMRADLPLRPRR